MRRVSDTLVTPLNLPSRRVRNRMLLLSLSFFFISTCTSLHDQALACCKYVQVLCKLLTDGGDDEKHNTKD